MIYISGYQKLVKLANDITITLAESTIEKLISTLEQSSQATIDWFKIIVNRDKFQTIVIKKSCRMKDSYALNINNQTINSEKCIKLLVIKKYNTLSHVLLYEGNKQKQERALRILYSDSTSDYNQLLNKLNEASNRLRNLALEVFKTLSNLNPTYPTHEINFYKTTNLTSRPLDIKVNQSHNTTKYGNKSLKISEPRIWNSLLKQIKEETNYLFSGAKVFFNVKLENTKFLHVNNI